MTSPRLMPAARTRTSSSPVPGSGSGCSRQASPPSTMVTACTVSAALVHRDVVPGAGAAVELPGPGDLLVLLQQLDPVREPPGGPGDGEQHGEHLQREPHRLVDEAGVEVDVRVEPPGDEVVVGERDLLQLEGDVEQGVAPGDGEDLVGGLLDDLRPGVVVLVDAVAEALELDLPGLHPPDVGVDLVDRADLLEHADDGLVGAAVAGSV